ncbi:holo-ACP synthase [Gammaproteobacteria bacterium AS21]
MIKGIGTDLLKIERVEKALARSDKFARRILTDQEYADFDKSTQPARFVAKKFAAKEAIVKALGTGIGNGVGWQHINISKDALGKPLVALSDGALERAKLLGATHYFLSYSDEKEYIVAMAVIE